MWQPGSDGLQMWRRGDSRARATGMPYLDWWAGLWVTDPSH